MIKRRHRSRRLCYCPHINQERTKGKGQEHIAGNKEQKTPKKKKKKKKQTQKNNHTHSPTQGREDEAAAWTPLIT